MYNEKMASYDIYEVKRALPGIKNNISVSEKKKEPEYNLSMYFIELTSIF
jgi:hypothetical protein